MRFSHYNKHLYKSGKIGRILLPFLLFAVAFFQPERMGRIKFLNIQSELKIQIPKSSVMIAALKDAKEKSFVVSVDEFSEMDSVGTTVLKPDEKYIRPTIINLKEGLRLSKEDYILGNYKYIDEKSSAMRLSKNEAKKLLEVETTVALEEQNLDINQWEEKVVAEEKLSFIRGLGFASDHQMFNRLNQLGLDELYALKEDTPMKDPVLEELEDRLNTADTSIVSRSADTYTVTYNNQDSQARLGRAPAVKPPESKPVKPENKEPPKEDNNKPETPTKEIAKTDSQKEGPASSAFTIASSDYIGAKKNPDPVYTTSGFKVESMDLVDPKDELDHDYRVRGEIQFIDGLAYLGPSTQLSVSLLRKNGSEKLVEMEMETASFIADVERDMVGLIVRYKDAAGRLLAHSYNTLKNHINDIKQKIDLTPLSLGFQLYLNSASEDPVVELDGKISRKATESVFIDETYSRHSNFLVAMESPDNQRQIQIMQSGVENRIELFSKKYVEDIQEILRSQGHYVDPSMAMVISRISNAKDSSGYSAEITDGNAIGPIYLNDFMIPDSGLSLSSRSGMFVFINVSSANHQVRIEKADQVVSMTAYTEAAALTKLDFSMAKKKSLKLQVLDYMNGQNLASSFQILGLEDKFQVGAQTAVNYTYLQNKAFHQVEYWAGPEYIPHRFHFVDRVDENYTKLLPAFKSKVLKQKLDLSLPILAVYTQSSWDALQLNHESINPRLQTIVGLNHDGVLEELTDFNQIASYPLVFVQGIAPGLHSVQIDSMGLKTNQLFIASPGFVSVVAN